MSFLLGIIFTFVIYCWGKWFFNEPTVDKFFISISGLWMFFIAVFIGLFFMNYIIQITRSIRGSGSDMVWNVELVCVIALLTIMLLITNIIRFTYLNKQREE